MRRWLSFWYQIKVWTRDLSENCPSDDIVLDQDDNDSFDSDRDHQGSLRIYINHRPIIPDPIRVYRQSTTRGSVPHLDQAADVVNSLGRAVRIAIADLSGRMDDGQRAPDTTGGFDPSSMIDPVNVASLRLDRLIKQYKQALGSARMYEQLTDAVPNYRHHVTYVVGVGGDEAQQVAPEHEGLPVYTNRNRLPMVARQFEGTATGVAWSPSSDTESIQPSPASPDPPAVQSKPTRSMTDAEAAQLAAADTAQEAAEDRARGKEIDALRDAEEKESRCRDPPYAGSLGHGRAVPVRTRSCSSASNTTPSEGQVNHHLFMTTSTSDAHHMN